MQYYPVSVDLQGRRCVVIGGGALAEEKVEGLLDTGGQVTIVAVELTDRLAQLVAAGRISHRQREYRTGDLVGAFLAICTTRDPRIAGPVWDEASALGILVNVVDDPLRCSFIAPSVLRRGDLTIAISTGGKAPALAVRLRERLEQEVGPEHAQFLELAGRLRFPLSARYPDFGERKSRWYRLVDSDVLELLRRGDEAGAWRMLVDIMGVEPEESAA
jgi:uroporphyrin-III C-methyltransferase/precorrin-2 dehydrogenase/sirohydrochlorin ferrochelatase/precorrin-2 dehydrogenase/sirohydrochlorin ferrochelatase